MRPFLLFGFLCTAAPTLAQQSDMLHAGHKIIPIDTTGASLRNTQQVIIINDPVSIDTTSYRLIYPAPTLLPHLTYIAGVQATPYSGEPGANVAVRIRGAASFADYTQPLYVVDGVPVFQGGFRTYSQYNDGYAEEGMNPLLSFPTEDIEKVEVLKSTIDTAPYSVWGTTGVIRITTRRGSAKQPLRVHYAGYGGIQQARYRYDLLAAQQYAELANEAAKTAGATPPYSAAQAASFGHGTDWQREMLRTAAVQEHHLGANGGTATTRYYVGADYLRQNGIIRNSWLHRYAVRANLNQQLGRNIQLNASAGLSQVNQQSPTQGISTLLARPTTPVRDANGQYSPQDYFRYNPVQVAEESYATPQQRQLLAQMGATYQVLPVLRLEVLGNLERSEVEREQYREARPIIKTPAGRERYWKGTYWRKTIQPALRYQQTLADRHELSASAEALLVSFEQEQEESRYMYVNGTYNEEAPGWYNSSSSNSSFSVKKWRIPTLSAAYQFDKRYEVRVSISRGMYNVFSSKSFWLPAAQLTWHAEQESFLKSNATISQLTVWADGGQTANAMAIGQNSAQGPSLPFSGDRLFIPTSERTTQWEAGTRLGLWQNQLSLTLLAYQKQTRVGTGRGYILNIPDAQDQKYGDIRNRGLELTITGNWQAGPLRGVSHLAAATNQNRWVANEGAFWGTRYQDLYDHKPLSTFFGRQVAGLTANGILSYRDQNQDGQINYEDNVALRSGLPRQLINLTQELTWRQLTLTAQLDGMFGYQVYNSALSYLESSSGLTNATTRVLDRWTPAHTNTTVPRANQNNDLLPVAAVLQSGNHVRMSNLTVSYPVWKRQARNVSVWVGAQNLFILTHYRGYDPNVSSGKYDSKQAGLDIGAYPTARTLLLGVRAAL